MEMFYEDLDISEQLDKKGYVYCNGRNSRDDFLDIASQLGQLGPQYDGKKIWSIKPNPESKGGYHSLSNGELQPHTECYEFKEEPPRYLALWCRKPGLEHEGFTYLGDLSQCLNETTTLHERSELASKPMTFFSTPGLQSEGLGNTYQGPMLHKRRDHEPVIRFSIRCMDSTSIPWMTERKQQMTQWLHNNSIEVRWTPGAYLIWDNHRMAHWRSAFSDLNRELVRVWLY